MAKPAPGSKMNTRAEPVEGGPPMEDKVLKAQRDLNRMAGREDTPRGRALEARYQNLRGHDKATEKAKKNIGRAKGGLVKSPASKRADGIATKGKTKGRMV